MYWKKTFPQMRLEKVAIEKVRERERALGGKGLSCHLATRRRELAGWA